MQLSTSLCLAYEVWHPSTDGRGGGVILVSFFHFTILFNRLKYRHSKCDQSFFFINTRGNDLGDCDLSIILAFIILLLSCQLSVFQLEVHGMVCLHLYSSSHFKITAFLCKIFLILDLYNSCWFVTENHWNFVVFLDHTHWVFLNLVLGLPLCSYCLYCLLLLSHFFQRKINCILFNKILSPYSVSKYVSNVFLK